MKNLSFLLILLCSTFSSCTQEIVLDLETGNDKIVIEGIVSNNSNTQTVKISKSIDFYEDNTYPAVTGAIVSISENGKTPIVLAETSEGIYQTNSLKGIPGNSYKLSVTIDKKVYYAKSVMPEVVLLEGIGISENIAFGASIDKTYSLIPIFKDPSEWQNYYRFFQYVDDVKDKTLFILNDNLINGQKNSSALFSSDTDFEIKSGSKIKLVMLGIEKPIYNYFYTISQNSGRSSEPFNPVSNISGDVLGYFSAQNTQEISMIVP